MNNYIKIISIDRVDSNGGYTKDNVVLVAPFINILKSDMDYEDFMNIIKLVYENNSSLQNSNQIFLPKKFFGKRPLDKSKLIYPE